MRPTHWDIEDTLVRLNAAVAQSIAFYDRDTRREPLPEMDDYSDWLHDFEQAPNT